MRVCICAIAKNENKYIKEWADYHLGIGVDKIFLYDNNDIDGEKLSDVLMDDTRIEIIDIRGNVTKWLQKKIYTEFWKNYKDGFDWVAFIDIDEFITLRNGGTIKEFLSRECFKEADIVRLNWMHFTDNNELDVVDGDYNVLQRFTERQVTNEDTYGKSIIRTSIDIGDNEITAHGYHGPNVFAVDADGKPCLNRDYWVNPRPNYDVAWISHYRTKTIGEYIRQKYFRGNLNNNQYNRYNLLNFWHLNEKTDEKEKYANDLIRQLKN